MSVRLAHIGDLPELRRQAGDAPFLAVDTEFHAERRYLPQLLLVQVHITGADTWILDPLVDGLLTGAADALIARPWVVHAGAQDLRLLQLALGGLPAVVHDTQVAAGLCSPRYPAGYAELHDTWLGQRIAKAATLSDWTRRPLSADQLAYAAEDVARLPDLYATLRARADALGRGALVDAAEEEARDDALSVRPQDAWREIAALASLDAAGLAVLRELAAWRERQAIAANTPSRSIASDGLLVELAKRKPVTAGAILENRRAPKNIQRDAATLAKTVREALAGPAELRPRAIPRGSDLELRLTYLLAWAAIAGHEASFAANLVLPRQRLEGVVLDGEGAMRDALGSWRMSLVGPALTAALRGDTSLRLRDGRAAIAPI